MIEQEINRNDLIYKAGNKEKNEIYHFHKDEYIKIFEKKNWWQFSIPKKVLEEWIRLKDKIDNFKESMKLKNSNK